MNNSKKKNVTDEVPVIEVLLDVMRMKSVRIMLLITVTIVILLNFVFKLAYAASGSMEPTIMTHDVAIYNRLAYISRDVKRGDIIAFKVGNDEWSKRVIGLPGDEIEFHDGYVFINGTLADESSYLDEDVETNSMDTFVVPEGHVFVLGDNREWSYDSRYMENPYISIDDIIGCYMFSIPFSAFDK